MLGAIKVAVGGELGIGVGEEGWGSGEREVLEGFISRTDGLVDMVVSRFGGRPPPESKVNPESSGKLKQSWAGSGRSVGHSDGVIFTGIGAISKDSLSVLTRWTELLYIKGEEAFGVTDSAWRLGIGTKDTSFNSHTSKRSQEIHSTSQGQSYQSGRRRDRPGIFGSGEFV
jgi:hypothetical protein